MKRVVFNVNSDALQAKFTCISRHDSTATKNNASKEVRMGSIKAII